MYKPQIISFLKHYYVNKDFLEIEKIISERD